MKTIQLQIDDKNYDSFMVIINNLRDGFVKFFTVNNSNISLVSDKEQNCYENLLNNMSEDDKIVSSKESIEL